MIGSYMTPPDSISEINDDNLKSELSEIRMNLRRRGCSTTSSSSPEGVGFEDRKVPIEEEELVVGFIFFWEKLFQILVYLFFSYTLVLL